LNVDFELSKAIDFEEKGFELYSDAAKTTKNPVVKATYEYLAEQEAAHKKALIAYGRGRVPDTKDMITDIHDFFGSTVERFKKKIAISSDDIGSHKTALELEKMSYDYYKVHSQKAEGNVKNFFEFLANQEKLHYELIEKAFYYISDPVGYNTREERWVPDGG
jgi:rubrerythrin